MKNFYLFKDNVKKIYEWGIGDIQSSEISDIMLDNVTHNKNILFAKNIDLDSILFSLVSRKGNKVKVNSKKQLDAFFERSKSKFDYNFLKILKIYLNLFPMNFH